MYGVYRVESRSLVGRPRKTLLESVEADMAELEIDKKEEVQPYRKTDYKLIIDIFNNGRYTTNIPTNPHTITTTV